MIPKKIHYCWLSNDPMPFKAKQCMASWKRVLPDYEWVKWDTTRFDIESVPFVNEAYLVKKYAFAADYIRLHALYEQGGIYLDTDVFVMKSFDTFLKHGFFSNIESFPTHKKSHNTFRSKNLNIQAAIMGARAKHPFVYDCMKYYVDKHFVLKNGRLNNKSLAPMVYSQVAKDFGFKYEDKKQFLSGNICIYPSTTFSSHLHLTEGVAYAIHLCSGSWADATLQTRKKKFVDKLKNNGFLRQLLNKTPQLVNRFSFPLSQYGQLVVRLFSLSANSLLKEFQLGHKTPGEHEFVFNDNRFPDGKYFCRVYLDDSFVTEAILIKASKPDGTRL